MERSPCFRVRRGAPAPRRARRADFPALPASGRNPPAPCRTSCACWGSTPRREPAAARHRAWRAAGTEPAPSYGIHADRPDGGLLLGFEGPVDAAGGMFGAALFEVVEGLGMSVEVFFGPGRFQLAFVGPMDAIPFFAAVGRDFRHGGRFRVP